MSGWERRGGNRRRREGETRGERRRWEETRGEVRAAGTRYLTKGVREGEVDGVY